MGIPYRVSIKMLACTRQALRAVAAAIKHAGILAQDGRPHRRGAAGGAVPTRWQGSGKRAAAGIGAAPAHAGELSYDDSREGKKFAENIQKIWDLSN